MKEHRRGNVIILSSNNAESPSIELPLEKPIWVTKKIDDDKFTNKKPTSWKKLLRHIQGILKKAPR